MRLFVALDIDEPIQQRLQDYVRMLAPRFPGVRFVRSANYHITLQFLGEVEAARVDEVRERLRQVRSPQIALSVAGVGFFPNARAPRVFWAGIQWAGIGRAGVESDPLAGLARSVGAALASMGFRQENEFHPHLTLARNGSGRPRPVRGERAPAAFAELARFVASSPAPEFGTMTARQFFLYESKLSPSGSVYGKIETFALDN